MQNIQKIRFLAANYANLQGLTTVPLGLLLVMVVIWANRQNSRASDLFPPILLSAAMLVAMIAIQRYYRTHYGKTERTSRQKRMELILGIAGGIVGLVAFALDTRFKLPVSLIGLTFAAAVIGEYMRMQWYAPGSYLLPLSAASFLIMLVASILPLLGVGQWWQYLGLRTQMFGVLLVAGGIIMINGLLGHWFFIHQLPAKTE